MVETNIGVIPKTSDIFISRLHPSASEADVLNIIKNDCLEATCNKLNLKHPELYSYFKINIKLANFILLMEPNKCPKDI